MLTVPEVNLEVVDRHARTGSVQFAWAIVTPDTREVLVFQFVAGRAGRVGYGEHSLGVDSRISHYTLEGIIRVGTL